MLASMTPDLDARELQIAATAVLSSIRNHESPLRAIGDALGDLAARVGAEHVVLGIDDKHLGRQVFTSNRAPLDTHTAPLFGPASLITDPAMTIDAEAAQLLIVAAELAFASLHASPNSAQLDSAETRVGLHLRNRLDAATAAACELGWGFALVLAQCDSPHGFSAAACAPEQDPCETYRLDDHELAFILPSTRATDIPEKLGQIAHRFGLPTMTFGVAMCPADGNDAHTVLAAAATRLKETLETRMFSTENPGMQPTITVPSAP